MLRFVVILSLQSQELWGRNLRPLILTAWLRSQLPRLEWENQEGKTKARKIGPGRLDLNAPDMEGREGRLTLF